MTEPSIYCKFCDAVSPDEGPCCEQCFDKGAHWLSADLQADAAAALHAVGTRVRIPDDLPRAAILSASGGGVPAGDIGVVVGCRAMAHDGQDVWTLKLESGSWVDVVCGWVEVLDRD